MPEWTFSNAFIERRPGLIGRGRMPMRMALLAVITWVGLPVGAAAQNGGTADQNGGAAERNGESAAADVLLFTEGRYFASPVADPHEPRFAVGLISTDLFMENTSPEERPPFSFGDPGDMAADLQAVVNIGGTLPLWGVEAWHGGGIMVGAQAGVSARFRMEEASRDAVGTDWLVALPVELAYGRYAWRFRLMHRSAHLGDELIGETGARRIEFGHEAVDLLVTRSIGRIGRIYAGGTMIFRSNTENQTVLRTLTRDDRAALQAGVEVQTYPWGDGRAGLLAALDWRIAERTGWRSAISTVAGFGLRARARSARLLVRYSAGPSATGEFFLTPESFWGVELVITP